MSHPNPVIFFFSIQSFYCSNLNVCTCFATLFADLVLFSVYLQATFTGDPELSQHAKLSRQLTPVWCLLQAASAGKGPICNTQTFTKVEDRPVVKEIKTYVKEHHPVEKEVSVHCSK